MRKKYFAPESKTIECEVTMQDNQSDPTHSGTGGNEGHDNLSKELDDFEDEANTWE